MSEENIEVQNNISNRHEFNTTAAVAVSGKKTQMKIAGSLMKTLIGVACGLLVCVGIAQAKKTVTWGMWGSPAEIKTHQRVADAFMVSHPDIEVIIWGQPWGCLLYTSDAADE